MTAISSKAHDEGLCKEAVVDEWLACWRGVPVDLGSSPTETSKFSAIRNFSYVVQEERHTGVGEREGITSQARGTHHGRHYKSNSSALLFTGAVHEVPQESLPHYRPHLGNNSKR